MGIPPVLERQPDLLAAIIGHAQSAFFGGRICAHIRRATVPVVYTDFLSPLGIPFPLLTVCDGKHSIAGGAG
jgi:hypothetical protein